MMQILQLCTQDCLLLTMVQVLVTVWSVEAWIILNTTTYLLIIKIRFKPVEHHGWGQSEAEIHESKSTNVRRVAVVDQTQHLDENISKFKFWNSRLK